jgi:hypothetical protein
MSDASHPTLSVAALFAERDARHQQDKEAAEKLQRKEQEELTKFKERLENFKLTDDAIQQLQDRIKHAFDRGESEVMLTSFPCGFCTDGGRAIANADTPPINKPGKDAAQKGPPEPPWLATLPAGARPIYDYWQKNLRPGGFTLSARITSYPGGKPGDVGLFFSWPRDALDAQT